MPMLIDSTLRALLNILIYIALIAAIMPWFLLALPGMVVLFVLFYVMFRAGVRELQRFQLLSFSPVLSHIDATLHGLTSIRAYDKVDDFKVK